MISSVTNYDNSRRIIVKNNAEVVIELEPGMTFCYKKVGNTYHVYVKNKERGYIPPKFRNDAVLKASSEVAISGIRYSRDSVSGNEWMYDQLVAEEPFEGFTEQHFMEVPAEESFEEVAEPQFKAVLAEEQSEEAAEQQVKPAEEQSEEATEQQVSKGVTFDVPQKKRQYSRRLTSEQKEEILKLHKEERKNKSEIADIMHITFQQVHYFLSNL